MKFTEKNYVKITHKYGTSKRYNDHLNRFKPSRQQDFQMMVITFSLNKYEKMGVYI